jgi:hypothetical protein
MLIERRREIILKMVYILSFRLLGSCEASLCEMRKEASHDLVVSSGPSVISKDFCKGFEGSIVSP